MSRTDPLTVDVGLLTAASIDFAISRGPRGTVRWRDGKVEWEGQLYDRLSFGSNPCPPLSSRPSFRLRGVNIGINFHWQQRRNLSYCGILTFIPENGLVTAVNTIGTENYLLSVISSEMKSSAGLSLLKAHAIIARSWLMARINDFRSGNNPPHRNYVVCSDDHCQRYQGCGMVKDSNVRRAIRETAGQILTHDGRICDARYSKCCGGTTELFSSCWEDTDPPYLQARPDTPRAAGMPNALVGMPLAVPVLDDKPFCDCHDKKILARVLNDYDLQTEDFFSWTERADRDEFARRLRLRTGIDFGRILSLEPLRRGPSGRIIELRVRGTLRCEVIGKELAIRRALSDTHLKSSAFEVVYDGDDIILQGRGWGHGVGLCQIGAAVMASRGYDYRQILSHYYPGAIISPFKGF